MAAHSSILAWRIPQTEEPGGIQSTGLQRVRRDRVTGHTATHAESKRDLSDKRSVEHEPSDQTNTNRLREESVPSQGLCGCSTILP